MTERLLVSFLSCHVCSETFRDPVSLSCNHSFCSNCLQKIWEQTGNKNCPICKRRSSKEFPDVHLTLKELADSFAGRQKMGLSETEQGEKHLVCRKHQDDTKLFCKDEQRAVCPVCVSNLSFRVWEKMKDKVHFSPVILDPNTASGWIHLSDDLTSVRFVDTEQQLPDNPERNTRYSHVFGSEGFSSGKHIWDVEVGDHPDWGLGLVKESSDRKGELQASPKYGIWCLLHRGRKHTNGLGKTLTVKKSLERIRVQLDYDMGDVSFYDSEDMTHIYTYRETFTEKLFPFFSISQATNVKTSDLKISHTELSGKV